MHPGQIDTPILAELFRDGAAQLNITEAEMEAALRARVPSGEFGSAEDIANGVLYLSSHEAQYVNGTHLLIDGGMALIT